MGEKRGVYRALVGKLDEKRPIRKPKRRREYNIQMDLQEVGLEINWINLAQDRYR
jgi:hypothetical protein